MCESLKYIIIEIYGFDSFRKPNIFNYSTEYKYCCNQDQLQHHISDDAF